MPSVFPTAILNTRVKIEYMYMKIQVKKQYFSEDFYGHYLTRRSDTIYFTNYALSF